MYGFEEIPAIGDPMIDARPWNNNNSPKALVSLSSPSSSTITMDRSVAKQPETNSKKYILIDIYNKVLKIINRAKIFCWSVKRKGKAYINVIKHGEKSYYNYTLQLKASNSKYFEKKTPRKIAIQNSHFIHHFSSSTAWKKSLGWDILIFEKYDFVSLHYSRLNQTK